MKISRQVQRSYSEEALPSPEFEEEAIEEVEPDPDDDDSAPYKTEMKNILHIILAEGMKAEKLGFYDIARTASARYAKLNMV